MAVYSYQSFNRPQKSRRIIGFVFLAVLIGIICALLGVRWFTSSLRAPEQSAKQDSTSTLRVVEGETLNSISSKLEANGIVRSSFAFRIYARLYHSDDIIQAGVYNFDALETTQTVISRLISGDVSREYITFVPGVRIADIKDQLIERGYDPSKVTDALNVNMHLDHPLVQDYIPEGADLEGYLYPETYSALNGDIHGVVEDALDAMYEVLNTVAPYYQEKGLTVHQAVILASIVEKEVSDPVERRFVAQVFLLRLQQSIPLESNATDTYPDSYDTYNIPSLPPGPLSTIGKTSIDAVANPETTDYLFFVTGNDCKTRFSRTLVEHEALQREYGVGCL